MGKPNFNCAANAMAPPTTLRVGRQAKEELMEKIREAGAEDPQNRKDKLLELTKYKVLRSWDFISSPFGNGSVSTLPKFVIIQRTDRTSSFAVATAEKKKHKGNVLCKVLFYRNVEGGGFELSFKWVRSFSIYVVKI